jgi:hypothetical protein
MTMKLSWMGHPIVLGWWRRTGNDKAMRGFFAGDNRQRMANENGQRQMQQQILRLRAKDDNFGGETRW